MAFWKIPSGGKDFTTDSMVITNVTITCHLAGIGFVGQLELRCLLPVLEKIAAVHMRRAG